MRQGDLTVITRITAGQEKNLDYLLTSLGKDAPGLLHHYFRRTRTLHFACWLIICPGPGKPSFLVLETNYDGDLDEHLEELIRYAAPALDRIYAACEGYPSSGCSDRQEVKKYLKNNAKPSFFYYVTFPGQTVSSIRNAIAVRKLTDRFLDRLRRKKLLAGLSKEQVDHEITAYFVDTAMVKPVPGPSTFLFWFTRLLSLLWLVIPTIVRLICLVFLFPSILWHECRDLKTAPSVPRPIDPRLYFPNALEAHHHLTTLTTIKAGFVRKHTLRTILVLFRTAAATVFPPGSLGPHRTVHFARWVLLDGKQMLFLVNHNESWDSYLGDFADVGCGVTPIWTNTEGFPPTRWLFLGGAAHVDGFKQWSREHNWNAPIFYSAYSKDTVRNLKVELRSRDRLAKAICIEEKRRAQLQQTKEVVEREDIQGIVTRGYHRLPFAQYLFLQIHNQGMAKAWLANLVGEVTTAAIRTNGKKSPNAINIAISAEGLTALGLDQRALESFPREFRVGMACSDRSAVLGDVGPNDPKNWQFGSESNAVHLMLLLYAESDTELAKLSNRLCNMPQFPSGLTEIWRQTCERIDAKEPFGFRDGISQPEIVGITRNRTREIPIKTGEFILGYKNEYGERPMMPMADGSGLSSAAKDIPHMSELGRNGSYLVVRKLSQNVEAFEKYLGSQAGGNPHLKELVAAKLFGRWRSGAPLALVPDRDNPALGASKILNNDFKYRSLDPNGYRCPIGSHIRRTNPRDSFGNSARTAERLARRHRIIRRGRSYRETNLDKEITDQGLMFVAVNADLARQFEFMQESWISNPNFAGLYAEPDPTFGNDSDKGHFTIPDTPADQHLYGLGRFVTVKGGAYLFLPGIRALNYLAH